MKANLRSDHETLETYARDYGGAVHLRPRAVVQPKSVDEIVEAVRYARRKGVRVAARGHGHQPFGQAQVRDGIVIDLRELNAVHAVAGDRVDVAAGADWSTVLTAALGARRTPTVLPNHLALTVGGTLSIGGVGIASLQHGAQVDGVRELEVVTGEGEVLRCSAGERGDLFQAALAGQGQCGILTRVALQLVAAASSVREDTVEYTDLEALLDDERRALTEGSVDGLVAMLMSTPHGWVQRLQVVRPSGSPDLSLINPRPLQTREVGFEELVRTSLYVEAPGARLDLGLLLPEPAAARFLREIQPRLTPPDLGAAMGLRVFVWDRTVFTRPLFRLPDSQRCVYIAILRAPTLDPDEATRALTGNRTLFEKARDLGGTLYPFAAVELTRDDWRRHYGDAWRAFEEAKRRYDPSNVFASGPDLFASG